MSDRHRNTRQDRADRKRTPLPVRAVGYMPQGTPGAMPPRKLDEKHFDRRRRSLKADRSDAA